MPGGRSLMDGGLGSSSTGPPSHRINQSARSSCPGRMDTGVLTTKPLTQSPSFQPQPTTSPPHSPEFVSALSPSTPPFYPSHQSPRSNLRDRSASLSVLDLPNKVHTRSEEIQSLDKLLEHAKPGTFIALDIDDTICASRYSPCYLMTETGLQKFQLLLGETPKYKQLPFSEKNAHTRRLQSCLREKRLMEPTTKSVLEKLHSAGCSVFGLTARYCEMAAGTRKVLLGLGIDLAKTAPFPAQDLRDPVTGALCAGGVIYTNARDKGLILNRFLEHIVFRNVIAKLPNLSAGLARLQRQKLGLPHEIIFVDDRKENCDCVANGLSITQKLGINVTSYHFNPETVPPPAGTNEQLHGTEDMIDPDILQFQLLHFVEMGQVLTNHEAAALRAGQTAADPLTVCTTDAPGVMKCTEPESPMSDIQSPIECPSSPELQAVSEEEEPEEEEEVRGREKEVITLPTDNNDEVPELQDSSDNPSEQENDDTEIVPMCNALIKKFDRFHSDKKICSSPAEEKTATAATIAPDTHDTNKRKPSNRNGKRRHNFKPLWETNVRRYSLA